MSQRTEPWFGMRPLAILIAKLITAEVELPDTSGICLLSLRRMVRGHLDASGGAQKAEEIAAGSAAGTSNLRADLEARRNSLLEWSKDMPAKRDLIVAAQKDVDDLLTE